MENKAVSSGINPTKQRKPSVGRGGVPTPAGFEAHPERRHNGAWKKEDTPRYKLEQMMKLNEKEIEAVLKDESATYFERKIAKCIVKGDWKVLDSMINQVYGQPKSTQETVISGEITQNQRPYQGMTKEELRKLLGK